MLISGAHRAAHMPRGARLAEAKHRRQPPTFVWLGGGRKLGLGNGALEAVFDLTSGTQTTSIMVQLGTWVQLEECKGSTRDHDKPELFPLFLHLWGHRVGEAAGRRGAPLTRLLQTG